MTILEMSYVIYLRYNMSNDNYKQTHAKIQFTTMYDANFCSVIISIIWVCINYYTTCTCSN